MGLVVYFSSVSENTRRFVDRLALPAVRIPLHDSGGEFRVDEPYVLITPTYGGGAHIVGRERGLVPKPVVRFLNNAHNRSLIRGVIAAGNTNFGETYCAAGDVISRKCQVPYLYRFELMGTADDVARVREGLGSFWEGTQWQRQPRSHRLGA
ncbi:class Ib ribonucleoside-diphosphate reductase assembly flavoprotein NrdI [Skermania sp. ID1734]|uniref:class Ib ribonucleoside-diphosphate reductase assembly flavoprotein NrdI n=1 Tax=Skermania sp. ID1734 TaxID=2597516 RepID=UPI0011801D04|nr:class Ib ribonucleoside-diphosphate reductase assembly flavoprotein NrdI [Skermania sp. ID1734]TSE01251.1 class Ib ribonucleoside-diphosphate reductase assembly flavoprotein NrdI [Skermania sp. ID1734]